MQRKKGRSRGKKWTNSWFRIKSAWIFSQHNFESLSSKVWQPVHKIWKTDNGVIHCWRSASCHKPRLNTQGFFLRWEWVHPWKVSLCLHAAATAAAKSLQSCLTLCDPRDGSPPGSPTPGILQARTLEWVAISFSNAWKGKVKVKSLSHVRPTLRDPMDCSLPGSSVHAIFQASLLFWLHRGR